ncbi:MAG: hypothetical protein LWX07_13515 [Bacteroidetes bacterium]|nr:hypothetical protein [Bacteroidota bacterium]
MKNKLYLIPAILLAISVIGLTAGYFAEKKNTGGAKTHKNDDASSLSVSADINDMPFFAGICGSGNKSYMLGFEDVSGRAGYNKFMTEAAGKSGFVYFSTSPGLPAWRAWLFEKLYGEKGLNGSGSVQTSDIKSSLFENPQYGFYEDNILKTLCQAQRSTYETEDNTIYGFRNDVSPSTGSKYGPDMYGAKGVWAEYGVNAPGYLVSGLIVNTEQVDNAVNSGAGHKGDSIWHIKPRMRIDSADARVLFDSVIARIEIYNYAGDTCKTVPIYGRSFFTQSCMYKGDYIEIYYFGIENSLFVSGSSLYSNKDMKIPHGPRGPDGKCRVDYRILWTGKCNLWVDYIRLDDGIANRLFQIGSFYVDKIGPQITGTRNSVLVFYEDEIRYNNLPALKLVTEQISRKTGMTADIVVLPFTASQKSFNGGGFIRP